VQIRDSIPPEVLFSDYPYFSSVIESLVQHSRETVLRVIDREGLGPEGLAVEIASNDGYLLQHYRDAGVPVLGIEPAANIAAVAEERGIPTICEFFGREVGRRLAAEGIRPGVVHANNVLGHVPDLDGFVAGLSALLAAGGTAVLEAPYVKDLLDAREFDTIYHEHLSYFSLTAIVELFGRHDLVVERVERIAIHGGSLRVFARRTHAARPDASVAALLAEEDGWHVRAPERYLEFAHEVRSMQAEIVGLLRRIRREGKTIAAYGAAAKGSTLLNTFGIGRSLLDFVVDASPHKQGCHMPGNGLEILHPRALVERLPDYVVLLAWNFADEILAQQREYIDRGGRFIVPIPRPRFV
jgi:hypothetical protein